VYTGYLILLLAQLSLPSLPFTIANFILFYFLLYISFALRNNRLEDHPIWLLQHIHFSHSNNSFPYIIISHDVGTIATNSIKSYFLNELNTKLAAIKVYEVELLLSWKLA
jgi:hypothetical protein